MRAWGVEYRVLRATGKGAWNVAWGDEGCGIWVGACGGWGDEA